MNRLLLIATLGLLLACGDSKHAGGSGIDIPNAVTAVALHQDGSPAANARVRIIDLGQWTNLVASNKSVILDSTTTQANGQFTVNLPSNTVINIEVLSDSDGVSAYFDSSLTSLTLKPLSNIKAKWTPGSIVRIVGTSFAQQADQNGMITFSAIPSLNSGLIGTQSNQSPVLLGSFELNSKDTLQLGTLTELHNSILLDDFEQDINLTKMDPYLKGSFWFTIADEHDGHQSTITPSTVDNESWLSALSDSSAANGRSITIHYQIIPTDSFASFAVLGCILGTGLNTDAIDSLQFMVVSDAKYVLSSNGPGKIAYEPTGTDWERIVVHRVDLDTSGINGKIDLLQFVFSDTTGTTFRLDDFRIYGDPFSLIQGN